MSAIPEVDPGTYTACCQLLFYEAECLDDNRLRDWLAILHPDITYRVPIRITRERTAGPGFATDSWHMDDDWTSLETRVARLETEHAWAEDPPSRLRHFVTNVRVAQADRPCEFRAKSNVLVFRGRADSPSYIFLSAERHDLLIVDSGRGQLRERVVFLDHTTLGTHNLSMFL